jgi:hypothetical protein
VSPPPEYRGWEIRQGGWAKRVGRGRKKLEEYRKCRRARMDKRCQRRRNEERKIGKQKTQKKERMKEGNKQRPVR